MSRKKTPKSKGASAPAASALPAANGSRPARPGTGRPGPQARPNGPPQPDRPSLGGGDFYDVAFKVMLVGDSGVGKTCLLVRFKDGAFLAGTFISTVGIDFRNKVLDVDGMKVKLQIWDTAGQERFRSVTHAYYRDAHALLLLYDVTNKASFDSIQAWLTEIQEYAQHNVVLMLLGNKVSTPTSPLLPGSTGGMRGRVSPGPALTKTPVPGGLCPGACGEEGGWGEAGQGVWTALHGDQRQDGPQRGLGLHSHCKGVEAALHEGPQ
ncbi:ras-related protein Rab-26 isoform X1 [Ursus arctos]|uniref:ras-related protein Rab-26 isoform X1 n=1 Tax=Ursus arctos TaxID=9644 RepID=UPI0025499E8D|nr:ras-related protein Rab-26 isoform X1 [Ursus arctos]